MNEYRQSKNLAPLEMNAAISGEALKHSTAMAGGKTAFGHDGFDNRAGAIKRQLTSARKFAENVAYGHLDAKGVVDIWLNSPGHRRNIEGPYNVTGIGTAKQEDGTIYFTQIFVAR
ncbi:MAG: CAP domain-containing protein [Williamsia sp.]|nr:CAP domain-containing protein [Williamsia sp.]